MEYPKPEERRRRLVQEILGEIPGQLDELGWIDEGEKRYFAEQRCRYEFTLTYLEKHLMPGSTILDVGSHVLHFAMAASKLGYRVTGTDVQEFANHPGLKIRRDTYGIADVRVCNLMADALPFEDETFDLLNCSETLEHLNFNPLPVIKEFHRVLRPGGIALITTPNALRLGSRVRLLIGRNTFASLHDMCFGDPYSAHYREYALAEVKQLLKWGGFTIEAGRTHYLYPATGVRKVLKTVVMATIPSCAGSLFVVGARQ